MEVRANTRIADVINNHDEAVRQYGRDNARKLEERINALARADNLKQMHALPGDLEVLSGDEARYSMKLAGGSGYRLIIEPTAAEDSDIPRDQHGGVDEAEVTSVTITDVRDYHD